MCSSMRKYLESPESTNSVTALGNKVLITVTTASLASDFEVDEA